MAEKDYSNEVLDGRYRLVHKLASGGMGSVYVGEHTTIGKKVAVKLLHTEFAGRESIVRRFYREAQTSALIKHANIIDIFDVGTTPWGEPYLVMEFLEGESLGELLSREGALDISAACGVMEPVLKALAAAHDSGVVHRDLKPENIFLVCTEDGPPVLKVIDFGISKFSEELGHTKLTREGSVLGTPEYMSPEQARGDSDLSLSSDLYAMGVILYEMLVGEVPHGGANYNEMMIRLLTEPPREPLELNPDFPEESRPVVMKALAKRSEDRYGSAPEMLQAIRELSGYVSRKQRLAAAFNGRANLSMAVGDLGAQTVDADSSEIAARVLGDMERTRTPGRTPGAWAFSGSQPIQAEARPRQWRLPLLTALLAASIAGAGSYYLGAGGVLEKTNEPATVGQMPLPVPVTEQIDAGNESVESEGIQITINNVPDGAKIYYEDTLVPMNPFRVEKKGTITPIRVTADGYRDYSIAVVPEKDLIVKIEMESTRRGKKIRKKARDTRSSTKVAKGSQPEEGKLNGNQQRIVYLKNKRALKKCYDASLSAADAPRDKTLSINLKVRVAPSGEVRGVRVLGSGAKVSSLSDCLKREVSTWVYPATTEFTQAEYNFAFMPQQ